VSIYASSCVCHNLVYTPLSLSLSLTSPSFYFISHCIVGPLLIHKSLCLYFIGVSRLVRVVYIAIHPFIPIYDRFTYLLCPPEYLQTPLALSPTIINAE